MKKPLQAGHLCFGDAFGDAFGDKLPEDIEGHYQVSNRVRDIV
jgi:hypothetical protein